MIMIRLFFTTFSLFSKLLLFNFKVTFEGVRGPDHRGDIAVDDIFFKDCKAPKVPCRGKLTVPRSLIRKSRFSILDSRKLRTSWLESSFETSKGFREFFETIFETLE